MTEKEKLPSALKNMMRGREIMELARKTDNFGEFRKGLLTKFHKGLTLNRALEIYRAVRGEE